MDTISDLVDSISRISNGALNGEQLMLIDNLLRHSSWFPEKKDHIYMFKLYKEMKIATEAELRIWEERYNFTHDQTISSKIAKSTQFLEQLDKIISNYTNAFSVLMNSYGDDKGKAFYLIYFRGYSAKDVSRELSWIATGTINNWKTQFQKDLENVHIEI